MGREDLVRTLLQIVIEQGGARRARLVRVRDGELEIAAEQTLAPEKRRGPSRPRRPRARRRAACPPRSFTTSRARRSAWCWTTPPPTPGGSPRTRTSPSARPRSVLCLPIRREGRVVALLYLENELAPGVFTPDRLVALELIAAQVAISLENALLLEREHEGRVEAEAASRRALILGEATALVSSTFDYKDVFRALTRLCVRELADWAVIDIVDNDRIVRIAAAHRDPVKEPLLGELAQRYAPRFGVPLTGDERHRAGTPTHLPDPAPEDVRRLCVDDRHFGIIQTAGRPERALRTAGGPGSAVRRAVARFGDAQPLRRRRRRAGGRDWPARRAGDRQRPAPRRDPARGPAAGPVSVDGLHELRTPITSLKLTIESLVHGTAAAAAAADGVLGAASSASCTAPTGWSTWSTSCST